jgi:alkanesulfonate monooxygenase SsuD/methylene tetrahydromethanopterin reductase-like flavin-dependent oxidoreductase (luciferase family)
VRFDDGVGKVDPACPPVSGTPEQIAQVFREFAAAGIAHVQVVLDPNTTGGIEQFAAVLELLDRPN